MAKVNDEDFSLREGAAGQPNAPPKKESLYTRASKRSQALFNSKGVRYTGKGIYIGGALLCGLVALILAISVFRILTDRGAVSFATFMEMLTNAPSVGFGWISKVTTYDFSGVPFGWLRSILRFFADITGVALWVTTAMANAISYIFYFLRWLFVA